MNEGVGVGISTIWLSISALEFLIIAEPTPVPTSNNPNETKASINAMCRLVTLLFFFTVAIKNKVH